MTATTTRDEEIRLIWTANQWLYMVVGFIGGVLFCFLAQQSILNLPELVRDLLPEATGIFVTVTVIDYLNRRRDSRNAIRQLKEQLVRDASSIVNDVANNAIHQLRKRDWLTDYNGPLVRADLVQANLRGADLWGANLQGANFEGANLEVANLNDTNLQGANLKVTNLKKASLQGTNLQGANFEGAHLQEAYLGFANLQGANLWVANLQGASLCETNLKKANLRYANLQGVKLICTTLFDEATILPDGTHWSKDTDMTKFTKPDGEKKSNWVWVQMYPVRFRSITHT